MRSALLSLAFSGMIFASSDSTHDSTDNDSMQFSLRKEGKLGLTNSYLAINKKGCYLQNCGDMAGCSPRLEISEPFNLTTFRLEQVQTNYSEIVYLRNIDNVQVKLACKKGVNNTEDNQTYRIIWDRYTV